MKVTCARKDLYEGVQTAARAVSSRTSLPILSHLMITAEDNKLRISATDLEIGLECIVEARVEEPGALTAPARILTDVIGSLPEADVMMSVDDSDTVSVKCGTSEFTVMGLPADEFPQLPEVNEEVRFTIDREILKDGIKKTAFGISQDEARAILTGVLLQVSDEGVKLVATDTHRLCVADCAILDSEGEVNAIIPGRAMSELMKIIPDVAGSVSVTISATQILFKIEQTALISRRIDGQFPNYEKVIPADFSQKLIVPTAQFMQSVKRAEIVARDNSHRTRLFTEDGTLLLTAQSGGVGSVREEVEVIKEGEDVRIAFNAKYLLDMLNVVDTEAIEIELSGEVSPAVIRPQGQDDYTYVLMPMQWE